jgi:pSer/pThr/pTyr-binding forkhead associated (FHA) protein
MSMSVRVKISCADPQSNQSEFIFDQPSRCTIGRARDCDIRVPADNGHIHVSRHHCLLDIDPPTVRVRDLGSLNGTYVNGHVVGRRPAADSLEIAMRPSEPRQLDNGDKVQVGDSVFQVDILSAEE